MVGDALRPGRVSSSPDGQKEDLVQASLMGQTVGT